jgi:phospholipid/cholesterol/gamma-HCH transport system substrate-binding protein
MPDQHKNDLNIEVIVGMFVFLVLIALGVFTIVLSRQKLFQETYPIHVTFEEVGGLRDGDNVFLRGTQVGIVKSTTLLEDHVDVFAELEVPLNLREDYKIEVVASSMLGGKILTIDEGSLSAPALAENAEIRGAIPVDVIEELAAAVVQIRTFSDGLASGQGTFGKLLNDDSLYQSLNEAAASFAEVGGKLERGEGTIGKLFQDETVYNDLQAVSKNLLALSERLSAPKGLLGELSSDDSQTYKDLQTSLAQIREVTAKINSGEGTLGKLIVDDKVYVEAEKLLAELRAALDDMRETSPVTTFGSVMFGAF